MQITARNIARLNQVSFHGSEFKPVEEICYDTRKIQRPAVTLFVALVTERNNGHYYLNDARNAGIHMFLVSELPTEIFEHESFALVPDTLLALQELAIQHRSEIRGTVIGITGSNGKTVVKEWLYACLNNHLSIYRSPRSYNSQLGVALSVLAVPADAEISILEAGISQKNEMQRLEKIIQPDVGIFTNLLTAHAENFSSREEHLAEKMKLFKNCKTIICSSRYKEIIHEARKQNKELFTWGETENDDLQILEILPQQNQESLLKLKFKDQLVEIRIPAKDSASLENAMQVAAYLFFSGLAADEIAHKIALIQPKEMRMESIPGIHNCLIINDTWSADITSLQLALDYLSIQAFTEKTLIVSDLPEGLANPDVYKTLAEWCNQKELNHVIGVGEQISNYASLFKSKKTFFLSTEELLEQLPVLNFRNECILLKGARIFRFERIAAQLQDKKHETLLEVNLSNLIDNLNYYRSRIGNGTRMMAMVKAFAYGSGSIEIARKLQFHGIDYLAVAFADEGVALRKAGINCPILVLSPETDSLRSMLEYNLEPEVYSFRVLDLLIREIQISAADSVSVQIKLDTGMHRLGFSGHDLEKLVSLLKQHREIKVSGVFSHLAASENEQEDEFTKLQISRFKEWSAFLEQEINYPVIKHILNSSGITRFPDAKFDMVRLGIGLYGIGNQEDQAFLKNVSCLKTTVSQIHTLNAGETVGYGRKGKILKPSKTATIPIGYADGFLRKLGNGNAHVYIKGQKAPTIGSICMDMCMLDITGLNNVSEGDEVIIFNSAEDVKRLAEWMQTIPYEVLTGISQRVKRIYIEQ